VAKLDLPNNEGPESVVSAAGSMWVSSHRGNTLYRIDPASNAVSAMIDVGQNTCGDLGTGFDRIWLSHCAEGAQAVVVDPATNKVVGRFTTGDPVFAFDANSVWTTSFPGDRLMRVDPKTLRTTATLDVSVFDVSPGGGYEWVAVADDAGEYKGSIAKVDPATNKVVATFQTRELTNPYMVFLGDSLWLSNQQDGTLVRVNTATGASQQFTVIPFAKMTQLYDVQLTTDGTNLYYRNGDGSVAEINPETASIVKSFAADPAGGGGGMGVGFGSLWVNNFGVGTLWRDDLRA
jgi:streptogramin lyase